MSQIKLTSEQRETLKWALHEAKTDKAHDLDMVSFYTSHGYSKEEAEQQALKRIPLYDRRIACLTDLLTPERTQVSPEDSNVVKAPSSGGKEEPSKVLDAVEEIAALCKQNVKHVRYEDIQKSDECVYTFDVGKWLFEALAGKYDLGRVDVARKFYRKK